MLNKYLLLILLPTASFGQDFVTPLGSMKYSASKDNTISVQSFMLKDKTERFSYTRNFSGVNTEQIFSAKLGNFSFLEKNSRIAKTNSFGFKNKDISLGYSQENINTQSKSEYSFANKAYALSIIDYNDKTHSKHFLGFKSKDVDFKSVNDKGLSVQSLAFGNSIIARDDSHTYVQSKYKDFSYKVSVGDSLSYSFGYKSLQYNDKQWFYGYQPSKNLYAQIGSDYKIHNLTYSTKIGDSNLSFKYTDRFDVYDFYFNQTVFSVYNNNFNMIGKSKTTYKDSTGLILSNSKYSLNVDAINDLYNITMKVNKNSSAGYLSDQKGKYLTLSDSSKIGAFNIGYNLNSNRIDRVQIGVGFKF